MDVGYLILSGAITIVSLILLMVSLQSYRMCGNKKLLFVFFVFLFFFLRGILLSIGLFYQPLEPFVTSYYTWFIDLIILTLLYLSALKR